MDISNRSNLPVGGLPGAMHSQANNAPSLEKQLAGLASTKATGSELKSSTYSGNAQINAFLGNSLSSLAESTGSERLRMAADRFGQDGQNVKNVGIQNTAIQLRLLSS